MRRSDREITDRTRMIEILQECDVIRLAVNDTPAPYIIPMSYGMEETEDGLILWFHSALEGTKIDLLRRDPHVSFEADTGRQLFYEEESMNCSTTYCSVIGSGIARFADDSEKLHGLQCLMAHYHMEPMPINEAVVPRTLVFCVQVTAMTGKQRTLPKNAKLQ